MSLIQNDNDISSRDPKVRKKIALKIKQNLEIALNDQPIEEITKLISNLTTEIYQCINSTDIYERLGGLTIIDSVLDVLRDDTATLVRFAIYHRLAINAVSTAGSEELIELSCQLLGHFGKIGGSQIADFLEKEVDNALDWLTNDHQSNRHLLALSMIKQLARNSPIIFYQKMQKFIDIIWFKLKSDKVVIRLAAYQALKEVLKILYQKESTEKTNWYQSLYNNITPYMSNEQINPEISKAKPEEIHGMLLIITGLVKAGDKFARDHFTEMMNFSLQCKDIKEKHIKSSVISIILNILNRISTYICKI